MKFCYIFIRIVNVNCYILLFYRKNYGCLFVAKLNICMQQKIYVCNKNYMYATKKYICARKVICMLQKNIYVQEKLYMCKKYYIYATKKYLCGREKYIYASKKFICKKNSVQGFSVN